VCLLPPHMICSAIETEWSWLIHDMRTRLLPPNMLYSAIEAEWRWLVHDMRTRLLPPHMLWSLTYGSMDVYLVDGL
jgi:hypothetical protein